MHLGLEDAAGELKRMNASTTANITKLVYMKPLNLAILKVK